MNLSRLQTTLTVVLPQAWPVILPPAIAFAVSFIKDTALVSQIGVFELTFRGKELNNQGFSGSSSSAPSRCAISSSPSRSACWASIWRNALPHLAVSDVRANYGALEVLQGISFRVDKGESRRLVGPSGSGKSTFCARWSA